MTDHAVTCPSCGASHDIKNPGIMMYTCEFCGNAIALDDERVSLAGKQSVLPEGFSRLYRGATGSLMKKRFEVMGRVRYSFGRGFWDEWYLEFDDGTTGWLSEDNQELCLEEEAKNAVVALFESYHLSSRIKIGDREFVVEETGMAECLGAEGDLPFAILPGEKFPYVDASSPDGRDSLGIEYDDAKPTVYIGHWLRYASLQMDDEGEDW